MDGFRKGKLDGPKVDRWINLLMDGLMNEHKDEQEGGWAGGLLDRKTWINVWVDGQIDGHMDDRCVNGWVKRRVSQ